MIPTGCRNLDKLLGGGLLESAITQVYGAPGSGKSNIALVSALNAAKLGKKVLFIDTEGSFHPERVKQVFKDKTMLKGVKLVNVSDFTQQEKVIMSLGKEKFDLIIVDSMTSLYRGEKTDENYIGISRTLGKQASKLLSYARDNQVPVLITNQVYMSLANGEDEPVGGDVLKYYSKVVVKIEKTGLIRKALLKKHVCAVDGTECLFIVTENGIKDA